MIAALLSPWVTSAASLEPPSKVVPVSRVDPRTGQTIQTIAVIPHIVRRATSVPDRNVKDLVEATAKEYAVSPELVDSVIQVESNYNPRAVSSKGAAGLMQLMPATARRFGVNDAFDPKENIKGGVKYLKFLQETFKDDRLAIAAYNAGEGAVSKYNNVPPYTETINYVSEVGKRYTKAKRATDAKDKANVAPDPPKPEFAPVRQYVDSEGRLHLTTQ